MLLGLYLCIVVNSFFTVFDHDEGDCKLVQFFFFSAVLPLYVVDVLSVFLMF